MIKPLAFCFSIALSLGAATYTGQSERVAFASKGARNHAQTVLDGPGWNLTTVFAMLFCLCVLELFVSIRMADEKKKKYSPNYIEDELTKMGF